MQAEPKQSGRGFWTRQRRREAIDVPLEIFYALAFLGVLFAINVWLGLIVAVASLGIFVVARAQNERAQRRREQERPELAEHRPHSFRLWRHPRS